MTKTLKKTSQILFVCVIATITFSGLCRTFLFPKEINAYENRKAYQPSGVSIDTFFNSEYQDTLESAFADQILFAEDAKKYYNRVESDITYYVLNNIYTAYPERYFEYNDILVFSSEYLLFSPKELTDSLKADFNMRIASINAVSAKYDDIEFYSYYIEKDTDMNFETKEKTGAYEYIESIINKENCHIAKYSIDSFDEFSQKFFKTDHHWNHIGAYDAYLQIADFLELDNIISKGPEYLVGTEMTGSKTAFAKNTEAWKDSVYAYKFDFPAMTIIENGTSVHDYGHQNLTSEEFLSKDETITYASYYGNDSGEIIFDTKQPSQDNILIIGESYDNAILKLLAAHFNKTISIDLRNYEHYMGKKFDFASYIEQNDIDKVLFIGNIDYFINEKFNVE